MSGQPLKTPHPKADANWKEFTEGIPGFVEAINDGMDCIVHLSHEMNTGPEAVIGMLTGSLADNLYDIMFLCAHERRDGALRLLRTPYEKYLYANFISKHPESAEDFIHFNSIQAKSLISGIEDHYNYKMSDHGREGLDNLVAAAQKKIKREKCKECGAGFPRMWTKVTPEQMAKDAGLESIHVLAYRYATLFIHPSWMGLSDQLNATIQLPSIVAVVHKLVFETIKLQWLQLKKTPTITGRSAEVIQRLVKVAQ